ncbi:hypothetical protein GCM10028806_58790 [Spirosoma terrae]|uniref:Helix-turn-helix domain-containing protein n=1 Tax=Spirosoma terrae TaxID=1968276 RepID=A0A6L9LK97_9BACT|nr:helix-turn-helix domain-containing protein [Spirosoma terrae]NDU99218.1 helix-turn-helix domain-containing protein [Spirosoma terrae]
MNIELITRADLNELAQKLETQIQRVAQLGQGSEQIIYDNDDLSLKMKVSSRTLQNWRDRGLIEFSQIGHKIYYTDKAVGKFLEDNKVKFWGK